MTQVKTCFDCKMFDVANWLAGLNKGLLASSTKGLWSYRDKRLHINVLDLKAVSLALGSFKDQCQNQTVLVAVLGSLHKQTRRNSLSRDVCSPLEDHDLVPSLSHNIESQTHSRVPECDGHPSVQVKPSAVNRMVTASTGVQTDVPKVVHTSCRLICHSSEPQTSTVRISCPRPKGLGHRCSEHKLDGSHCLCLPSKSFLDRNHFCTPRLVAKSHKRDERCRPSSQRPQHPTLYRRLK